MTADLRGRALFALRNWFWVWRCRVADRARQLMCVTDSPHAARAVAYSLVRASPDHYLNCTCYVTRGGHGDAKSLFEIWYTPATLEVRDDMKRDPELALLDGLVESSGSFPRDDQPTPPPPPTQE